MLFVSCVSYAFASVHCCLVVTCWKRADLLALVGDVYCIFVTFPCGILGQVWYLIVSFPDLCRLSYFSVHYCLFSHWSLILSESFIVLSFVSIGASVEAGGFANLEFNPLRSVEGCMYKITQEELDVLDKCVGYPEVRK